MGKALSQDLLWVIVEKRLFYGDTLEKIAADTRVILRSGLAVRRNLKICTQLGAVHLKRLKRLKRPYVTRAAGEANFEYANACK